MKNLKTIALALTVVFYFICNGKQKVDASKSSINWVGKESNGQHSGTVSGTLIFREIN
jgi:hypothetical protein